MDTYYIILIVSCITSLVLGMIIGQRIRHSRLLILLSMLAVLAASLVSAFTESLSNYRDVAATLLLLCVIGIRVGLSGLRR